MSCQIRSHHGSKVGCPCWAVVVNTAHICHYTAAGPMAGSLSYMGAASKRRSKNASASIQRLTVKCLEKSSGVNLPKASILLLQQLILFKVPPIVVRLAFVVLMMKGLNHTQDVRHVEYFSGDQAVTNAFLERGEVAIPFDVKNDPVYQSLNSDMGFVAAIHYNLKIACGGGFLAAPVCSSWVWVNRATAGRSISQPLGKWRHPYVHRANIQVSRLVILCWMAMARGLMWVVEQPKGSLLEHHPRWQELTRRTKVFRWNVYMSAFGTQAPKATWLYSNYPEIRNIHLFETGPPKKRKHMELAVHYKDDNGVKRTRGGKDLKASQSYTPGFGCSPHFESIGWVGGWVGGCSGGRVCGWVGGSDCERLGERVAGW
jgi:hypothetical protein